MKSAKSHCSVTLLCLWLFLPIFLMGCGKTESVPDGALITIDPATQDFANLTSDTIADFTVTARYVDGTPIPFANLRIEGAFAVPNGHAAYQFYYYPGGTQDPNNVAVDSRYTAQTDRFGVYRFSIVVAAGNTFNDTIRVSSGTASGTCELTVTQTGN